jgi:hypothetical protein
MYIPSTNILRPPIISKNNPSLTLKFSAYKFHELNVLPVESSNITSGLTISARVTVGKNQHILIFVDFGVSES